MKKKISILTLILLFFISTTGLPVFYHYCEINGESSFTECSDCVIEEQEISTCCAEENTKDNLKPGVENSSCCFDKFDLKKIEDDFSQISNSNLTIHNCIFISDATFLQSEKSETNWQNNNLNLPPPKFGKYLLKTIHQLKLDPATC